MEFLAHMANNHTKFFQQKEVFTKEKSSTPTALIWNANMATISLF